MSGPVTPADSPPRELGADASAPCVEVSESRLAQIGALTVRRALPKRSRRTVGAWCFADHMGPVTVTERDGVDIGPHPHIGLQTVTWLVSGELLHRDSVGSEVSIRPGQLNLMTAGGGVAHAEESPMRKSRYRGEMHGIQLWVAQPEATRHGPPAFEHHAELPLVELDGGVATVLVGALAGTESPARRDTDHVGVDLALRSGRTVVPVEQEHEHALVVLAGAVSVGGTVVEPGHLAYLGLGRDEIALDASLDTRVVLLGGVPFPEPIMMWWNFVARDATEMIRAYTHWQDGDSRFGEVASPLERIPAPPPPFRGERD